MIEHLTGDQERAFQATKSGHNILVIGQNGPVKAYLLRYLVILCNANIICPLSMIRSRLPDKFIKKKKKRLESEGRTSV